MSDNGNAVAVLTVGELRRALEQVPEDTRVVVDGYCGDFDDVFVQWVRAAIGSEGPGGYTGEHGHVRCRAPEDIDRAPVAPAWVLCLSRYLGLEVEAPAELQALLQDGRREQEGSMNDWRDPKTTPEEHAAEAVLALRVMEDNAAAGMEEAYRLAWWDKRHRCWHLLDAEDWFGGDTLWAGSTWLLGWMPLTHPQATGGVE